MGSIGIDLPLPESEPQAEIRTVAVRVKRTWTWKVHSQEPLDRSLPPQIEPFLGYLRLRPSRIIPSCCA